MAPVTPASTSRSISGPITAATRSVAAAEPPATARTAARRCGGCCRGGGPPRPGRSDPGRRPVPPGRAALPPLRACSSSARASPTMARAACRSNGSSVSVTVVPGSAMPSSARVAATTSTRSPARWTGACDNQRAVARSARCASSTIRTTGCRRASRRTAPVTAPWRMPWPRTGSAERGEGRRPRRGGVRAQQRSQHRRIGPEDGVEATGPRVPRQCGDEIDQGLQGEGLAQFVAGDRGHADRGRGKTLRPRAQQPGLPHAGLPLDRAQDAPARRGVLEQHIELAQGLLATGKVRPGSRGERPGGARPSLGQAGWPAAQDPGVELLCLGLGAGAEVFGEERGESARTSRVRRRNGPSRPGRPGVSAGRPRRRGRPPAAGAPRARRPPRPPSGRRRPAARGGGVAATARPRRTRPRPTTGHVRRRGAAPGPARGRRPRPTGPPPGLPVRGGARPRWRSRRGHRGRASRRRAGIRRPCARSSRRPGRRAGG